MPARMVLPGAAFGVISDIDDTVVKTGATELLSHGAHRVPRQRAHAPAVRGRRRAVRGAASRATTGARKNPLFYVSSSPWNLYELLVEFLELQKIPLGPLMLRDWGVIADELLPRGPRVAQARRRSTASSTTYPELPFLLVGDSGQEDPEIYASVIHDFPDRILGAYIRSAHPDPLRAKAVRDLGMELAKTGGVLLLADDSATVMADARKRGWIR